MLCVLPPGLATAGVEHAEAMVFTANVAVTATFPETVEFGSKKQPFVRAGLLETVQATVPV
jgi:hypothetical protein